MLVWYQTGLRKKLGPQSEAAGESVAASSGVVDLVCRSGSLLMVLAMFGILLFMSGPE